MNIQWVCSIAEWSSCSVYNNVCMCVCVYVCMCVCMHVCMYVCTHACMYYVCMGHAYNM